MCKNMGIQKRLSKCHSRQTLFSGYEKLVDAFNLVGLPSTQWIGGSFISTLPDPNDIDLVNFCRVTDYDNLSAETRAMIKLVIQDKITAVHCHCDSYFVPVPENTTHTDDFLTIQAYWKKKLGHDKIGRPKGIVQRQIERPPVEEDATEEETEESVNATAA